MRILALRAKGLVLPAIHAFLVHAFRSLGVHILDVSIPLGSNEADVFRRLAREGHADAIFTLDLGGEPSFIRRMRELQRELKLPWIVWFVDDPEGYGFPETCDPDWTVAFCWDRNIVEQSGPWRGRPLEHLPLATDPSVFFPGCGPPCSPNIQGVFVGSTAHPNGMIESVLDANPGVRGAAESVWEAYRMDFGQSLHTLVWEMASMTAGRAVGEIRESPLWRLWVQACVFQVGIWKRQEVVRCVLGPSGAVFGDPGWVERVDDGVYRGPVEYGAALREVYTSSAYILEVRQPQARTGPSQRPFDGSACERPVLAERSPELETLFEPEKEILCFRTVEEGAEARDRCLRHPSESGARARRARRRVLAHHTFVHRARRIIAACRDFLG